MIIDVRQPSFFNQAHIPGAVNAWMLSDAEAEEVSALEAASDVTAEEAACKFWQANIYRHMNRLMGGLEPGSEAVVYGRCMEEDANVMARVLRMRGVVTRVIEGGFKSYRNEIESKLKSLGKRLEYRVIAGSASVGKSAVIAALAEEGEQTVSVRDLLAKAKVEVSSATLPGSELLMYQSLLCEKLVMFDESRPVWIESGEAWIADDRLPAVIRDGINSNSKVYMLQAPLPQRVAFRVKHKGSEWDDPLKLVNEIAAKTRFASPEEIDQWVKLCDETSTENLSAKILTEHYDRQHRELVKELNAKFYDVTWLSINNLDNDTFEAVAKSLIKDYRPNEKPVKRTKRT